MVKLTPVGKQRPFVRGLLLTVLTVGLYAVYWLYKTPHEVYEQFELHEERREEGIIWLVTGLVVPFLVFVYLWKSVENVRYVRRRLGLDDGVGPGVFLSLHLLGPAVALLLAAGLMGLTAAEGGAGASDAVVTALASLTFGVVIGSLALVAFAYFLLQRSINEVWTAWAERARLFRNAAPQPSAPA